MRPWMWHAFLHVRDLCPQHLPRQSSVAEDDHAAAALANGAADALQADSHAMEQSFSSTA